MSSVADHAGQEFLLSAVDKRQHFGDNRSADNIDN